MAARTNSITITLPLPPRELSPNARVHHHARGRAVKKYRLIVWSLTYPHMAHEMRGNPVRWATATEQATFYFRDRRHSDPDNLLAMLKPVWDELQVMGILANDRYMTHLPVKVGIDAANPRVEITVSEGGAE